jgi:hypothetical protein
MQVIAHWTPIGKGRDGLDHVVHPVVYSWFTELRPARCQATYTERDFSGFLPEVVGEIGQVWALDPIRVTRFLRQFHPRPSLQLTAAGRRAGPDGAFAILRAASPSYLDIVFRIHAEFYLTPADWDPLAPIDAWYSPAHFSGRILVNKRAGTVDCFRLALPTDKALNVHLTVAARRMGYNTQSHDIVRVECLELSGGEDPDNIPWERALSPGEALARLTKIFYRSYEIDWLPFDQVLAQARSRNRLIFAIVSWGALDDQSC